ncbi:MAG: ABC transporter substrate-binding protein [Desulfurococcaceae archaeon]
MTTDAAMAVVVLGASDSLVGIPKYAVGAPWAPNATDVGTYSAPNIEAIISVEPEVVLTYVSWPKVEELEGRLEPLGIRVVRLDLYKPETMFVEFKLLGLMLNRTGEAEGVAAYWRGVADVIEARVAGLKPEEKLRVYWEGYSDYSAAGPSSGWDTILRLAGGVNVFADSPISYPKVSPEAVVERNPDAIVKSGSPSAYDPYKAVDLKPLEGVRSGIMGRPGWSGVKAVEEGRVYVLCTSYLHYLFGMVAERAYVAKALYPSLFGDVDPEAMLRTWIEGNLKMEWRGGVWFYPSP